MKKTAETEPRLLTAEEVLTRTGLSRSVFYRLLAAGKFPLPIRLVSGLKLVNGSCRGWYENEVCGWISAALKKCERVKYGPGKKTKEGKR